MALILFSAWTFLLAQYQMDLRPLDAKALEISTEYKIAFNETWTLTSGKRKYWLYRMTLYSDYQQFDFGAVVINL